MFTTSIRKEKTVPAILPITTASTLANLVNNRVTINGIVNAVKGGAIDGHLIFLSPNGIAVGSSGVINAGQFTGIVPTPEAFNKLYNTQTPATDITLAAINQIKDGAYAAVKTDDEGVVQGTIDIRGQINTHSGVMLGAGIINIKDGAKIQSTKNLDFTNLVNIQSGANAGFKTQTTKKRRRRMRSAGANALRIFLLLLILGRMPQQRASKSPAAPGQ